MITPTNIDWTPLAGIQPHPKAGRAFSTFTADEGDRIRAFYRQSGLPMRVIAGHLAVNEQVIYKIVHAQTKYVRRNMHGKTKARYWRRKAQRHGTSARAWNKEVSE